MQSYGLESILSSDLRHVGDLEITGLIVLEEQSLARPASIGYALGETEPVEHLHCVWGHPDAGTDFRKPARALNNFDSIAALVESNRKRQASDSCALDQDVAIVPLLIRIAHRPILRGLAWETR